MLLTAPGVYNTPPHSPTSIAWASGQQKVKCKLRAWLRIREGPERASGQPLSAPAGRDSTMGRYLFSIFPPNCNRCIDKSQGICRRNASRTFAVKSQKTKTIRVPLDLANADQRVWRSGSRDRPSRVDPKIREFPCSWFWEGSSHFASTVGGLASADL